MRKTAVLNIVGLSRGLIGPHTPRLCDYLLRSRYASVGHITPAVTCSVQSTYLTGRWPSEHGIVGNGWYDRDESEIKFWKQSNALVQGPKIWDAARAIDPTFTCANMCWWFAMYSGADITVTPRPMYPADGRKLPDVWTHPPDLRQSLQRELGTFPLFQFWGPGAGIASTEWIARAAEQVETQFDPTLSLVYLPHLDYVLQREGPDGPTVANELAAIDRVAGRLIDFFEARQSAVIVLSEYGIEPVDTPVHLNRVLREAGLLRVREELGHELLDAGESDAFAVADHQIAHVYVKDRSRLLTVRQLLVGTPGVETVLDHAEQAIHNIAHQRAGDLVVIAKPRAWFTYYYWLDDARRPDFANTVDIHRKPGYDPAELFLDPSKPAIKFRIAYRLMQKRLGFRYRMDVIPHSAELVRGSHGRAPASTDEAPLIFSRWMTASTPAAVAPTAVHDIILAHLQRD